MRVIVAPNSIEVYGIRVFLAGAIDMGQAEDWQAKVVASCPDVPDLTFINPRREAFTPDTLDEQIHWELDALEKTDWIFMWLPSTSKVPISFFEAGLYWKSGKLLIGAGSEFYRRRNLEITAERYGVPLFDNLDEQLNALLTRIDQFQAKKTLPIMGGPYHDN